MDLLHQTDRMFFEKTELDLARTQKIVCDALAAADDGELFLEMRHSEMLMFDDGRLKTASYDQSSGFGLRAVAGDAHGYAHAGELSESALKRAVESACQPRPEDIMVTPPWHPPLATMRRSTPMKTR